MDEAASQPARFYRSEHRPRIASTSRSFPRASDVHSCLPTATCPRPDGAMENGEGSRGGSMIRHILQGLRMTHPSDIRCPYAPRCAASFTPWSASSRQTPKSPPRVLLTGRRRRGRPRRKRPRRGDPGTDQSEGERACFSGRVTSREGTRWGGGVKKRSKTELSVSSQSHSRGEARTPRNGE